MNDQQEEDISASEMLDNLLTELVAGMNKCVVHASSSTKNTDVYQMLRGVANAVQYTQQRIEAGEV